MSLRGVAGYWLVAGFLFLAAVPFMQGRYVATYGTAHSGAVLRDPGQG